MRWVVRGIFVAVLFIGWIFIGWQNKFHVTAPVVFVGLGYLAVISTVYNLWRTGAAAVAPDDEGEAAWTRPAGKHGELEKEKRTLLKAIKEAEFDHEMGKLSKADADDLIRMYRARAIEVIKELDRPEARAEVGSEARQVGSVRERIDREVKARLELVDKKPSAKKGKQAKRGKPETAGAAGTSPDAKAADDTDAEGARDRIANELTERRAEKAAGETAEAAATAEPDSGESKEVSQ
jgi:hypothetical protein